MKALIHATRKENLYRIREEGFKIIKDEYPPRFGYGIYFMTSEEYGYSDERTSRIYCSLKDANLLEVTHDEIRNMYPELEIEYQEGGAPILESYAKENKIDAIKISYSDNTAEVVVYNLSCIVCDDYDIREL